MRRNWCKRSHELNQSMDADNNNDEGKNTFQQYSRGSASHLPYKGPIAKQLSEKGRVILMP
jgi:hypothetical protein